MNRKLALLGAVLGIGASMLFPGGSFAAEPSATPLATPRAAAVAAAPAQGPAAAGSVQISLDKTSLKNCGVINLSGTAPAGASVHIEVWSRRTVRTDLFDAKKDKKTGKTPYILYMTEEMPAFYKILIPADRKGALKAAKAKGKNWGCQATLKDCGALEAFNAPGAIHIDRYHVSLLGSVVGSRGTLLPAMNAKENNVLAMKLLKVRYKTPGAIIVPVVVTRPDGSFTAKIAVPEGSPGGVFSV